ncbi:Protein MAIN-LIKE 1 [Glycine soja]
MEALATVEDIHADIPADAGTEATEDQHQGFSSGPSDPSVLTAYADHVACSVWTGEERPELKLSSHGRKVHSLGRPVPAIEGLIVGIGRSPLIACSVDIGDRGLLSTFVERWHRETSSFHLPVGELTITLDDVSSLLHFPVIGDLHTFEPLHVDDAIQMLVDLLMVSPESARAEIVQCCGLYVRLQWIRDIYQRRCQTGHWTAAARAYLLHLLGCTLFANKSATNVNVVYLEALRDLNMTERYAWGVAALVHMYDQLNDASMSHSRQLGGYITLLQCWIYERFPSVAESTADQDFDEASPHACRVFGNRLHMMCNRLHTFKPLIETKKTVKSIRTLSYRERLDPLRIPDVWPAAVYYRPERVVRQFGYMQTIHAPPVDSRVSYDDIHDRWMHYDDHIVLASEPRVIPQAPQTNIHRVPEPGASSTSAEEPRHAVEVCDDIAERLERHLSLGVVTPGSSTHEVIEECLRLTRSVTQDHLVYVRCRRRRHTDQA